MKAKPATATLTLTARQFWLLKCGFDQSYSPDQNDPNAEDMATVSRKLTAAWINAHSKETQQ